jgi:thiamine-phosphate pyrophosphorylase
VQLRDKDLAGRELLCLAERLRVATSACGAELWVNDRVDVALAVAADGVQLGAATIPVPVVRGFVPSWMRIGYSAHAVAEAAECDADVVVFGPVWETPSKREFGAPQGPERLREAAREAAAPVVAIGGIDADRARTARAAGAAGVAVIRAILAADEPAAATRALLDATAP